MEKAEQPPAVPAPILPLPWSALAAGGRHTETLSSAQIRRYEVSLPADQYLHLIVEQLGVDVAATIRDPAGRRLLRVDSPSGANGPEDLFLVAETAGRHLLEVESYEGAGRYEIRVEAFRAATKADRTRAAAARAYSRARILEHEKAGSPAAAVGYRQAARLWRELEEEGREAWALYRLGLIYAGDPALRRETAETFARAASLFGRAGDERQQAVTLSLLAEALSLLGRYDQAGRCHEQALAFWEEQDNLAEQATRLNDLAIIRRLQRRTHAAIDLYNRAVDLWRKLGRTRDLATTLTNLGLLYDTLGESRMALDQYRRALALLDQRKDPVKRAFTLTKTGDALLKLEGPGPALERYREALELRRREHDVRGQAVTLNSIGLAQLEANRPREALHAFSSAVEIFLRLREDSSQAVALNNLGLAYERLGHPGRARELYERALGLSPEEETVLFGLARVAREEGRLEESERWSERGLKVVEAIRERIWRPDLRWSYHATQQEQYGFLIDVLAERHQREPGAGHDARAFAVSERARARSLLDLLSVAGDRPDPEEMRRLDELSRRINALHLELLAGTRRSIPDGEREKLTGLLERRRQARAAEGPVLPRSVSPPMLSLPQVQTRLLEQETLLLEFFLGEERSFLWAVTPTEARFVNTLPGREQIEKAARRMYDRILESHHQTGEIAARQAAVKLSRMILGPVADLLGRRHLVIVAPGALQMVPFAALPRPVAGEGVEARELIADHEIVSLPSASVLAALRARINDRKPPPGLLAVVADPVLGRDDERLKALQSRGRAVASSPAWRAMPLRRLPFAGREAESILALAGAGPVLSASGFQASRDLVRSGRLKGYRILHFATHSLFNDLYPELSTLALSTFDATGRPVDGHLRAYEISDLDLRADLVVLSACRTGLGKEVAGEGLVGLTHGFLHAGVPSLIVSLWDVDDRATSELMKRFYAGLLSRNLSPAQALRQAQLSLRREERWRSPYHWAGFVLQGEWR